MTDRAGEKVKGLVGHCAGWRPGLRGHGCQSRQHDGSHFGFVSCFHGFMFFC